MRMTDIEWLQRFTIDNDGKIHVERYGDPLDPDALWVASVRWETPWMRRPISGMIHDTRADAIASLASRIRRLEREAAIVSIFDAASDRGWAVLASSSDVGDRMAPHVTITGQGLSVDEGPSEDAWADALDALARLGNPVRFP